MLTSLAKFSFEEFTGFRGTAVRAMTRGECRSSAALALLIELLILIDEALFEWLSWGGCGGLGGLDEFRECSRC